MAVERFYASASKGGSDSNNGQTISTPRLTLPTISSGKFSDGQTSSIEIVSVLAGSRYVGSAASPWNITLPFGDDEQVVVRTVWPVGQLSSRAWMFDCYLYEPGSATGWTHVANGVWQKTFTDEVERIWTGVTQNDPYSVIGRGAVCYAGSAANVGTLTAKGIRRVWFWGTGLAGGGSLANQLTVFTGSTTTNPANFYSGLAMVTANRGRNGIFIRSPRNFRFSDFEFHGGGALDQFNVWAGNNITSFGGLFERISTFSPARRMGIRWNAEDINHVSNDLTYDGCLVDNKSSENENEDTPGWGSNNGFGATGQCRDIVVKNFVARGGFRHTYLQYQSRGATATREIGRGVTFQDGVIQAEDSDYSHPLDMDAEGWLITRVKVSGTVGRSQFGGRGVLRSCEFTNNRDALQTGNTNVEQIVWVQNWSTNSDRGVIDITIEACLIVNAIGTPIALFYDGGVTSWPENAVKIRHCTIIDFARGSRVECVKMDGQNATWPIPGFTSQNNLFITTSATPFRIETATGVFTNFAENSAPGASGNKRFASLGEAKLDMTYRPKSTTVPGLGVSAGYATDALGAVRPIPPTAGWKEPHVPRGARL